MNLNKYKIIKSEKKVEERKKNRRLQVQSVFKSGNDKTISSIFIAIYELQPLSNTMLIESLAKDYDIFLNKQSIYYRLQKLLNWGIILRKSIGGCRGDSDKINEKIAKIHKKYLETFPPNFKQTFDKQQYYYISPFGEEFIPFVVENVLGFEVSKNGGKDENIKKT